MQGQKGPRDAGENHTYTGSIKLLQTSSIWRYYMLLEVLRVGMSHVEN